MSESESRHEEFRWWWAKIPLSWIKEEGMSARRRIAGITAIAPGEVRTPFRYRANPYPFYYRPGKRARREAEPAQQAFLQDAYEDFQEHFARACAAPGRSKQLISVPAVIPYSPRIRDQMKAVLCCLYSFRSKNDDGDYATGGWHNRRLLMNRVCAAYTRRYVDGTEEEQCDSGGLDQLLNKLEDRGFIRFQEAERDGKRVIVFLFGSDFEDRLGPVPIMPSARKVQAWVRRWGRASEGYLLDPAEPPTEPAMPPRNLSNER